MHIDLSIFVGSSLAIVGSLVAFAYRFFTQNARNEARLDTLERRLDALDSTTSRLIDVCARIEAHLARIETKLDYLDSYVAETKTDLKEMRDARKAR